jgi:ATP synthase protein I
MAPGDSSRGQAPGDRPRGEPVDTRRPAESWQAEEPAREARPPDALRAYSSGMSEAGPYLVIGVQIAGSMGVFIAAGYFADRWLGTSPWLLMLGAVLGMVAFVATLVRTTNELNAREKARKAQAQRRDADKRR